jgi:hypothetical protein
MAEAPTSTARSGPATVTEALAAVAVALADEDQSMESVTVRQATPTVYVYRAFPDDGSEYVGGSVTLS